MTLNSKHRTQAENSGRETIVFQKDRYKILTYTSLFEQNNDHMQISHEIEFHSSFKSKETKSQIKVHLISC